MAGKAGPDINEFGLVGYWDAANVKSYPGSGTIWRDLSGNGNHGTLSTGSIGTVSGSGVMAFNGSNDYVDLSKDPEFEKPATISMWFRADLLANTLIGYDWVYWSLGFSSNKINYYMYDGAQHNWLSTTPLITKQWYHLVVISDNTSSEIYIDGKSDGISETITWFDHIGGANHDLEIGALNNGTGQPFNGQISNVQIYDRMLSQSEITQNFQAMRSRYGI